MSRLPLWVLSIVILSVAQTASPHLQTNVTEQPQTIQILSYNVYAFPTYIQWSAQEERMKLIPNVLAGHIPLSEVDVIVLQEAWDDRCRHTLMRGFGDYGFEFSSPVLPRQGWKLLNGGVVILSRQPIVRTAYHIFGISLPQQNRICASFDCLAAKGVVYAEIERGNTVSRQRVHIFGTHLQSGRTQIKKDARQAQVKELAHFIHSFKLPPAEPVFLVGDLNIDRFEHPEELAFLLDRVRATLPTPVGLNFTIDPFRTISFHPRPIGGNHGAAYLDYVLPLSEHLTDPTNGTQETVLLKSPAFHSCLLPFGLRLMFHNLLWQLQRWCWIALPPLTEIVDLSDHLPVLGKFRL